MLAFPSTTRCRNIGVLAIITLFLLLALGESAAQPASLYALIPLDSPVTASVDVPWLWKTSAPLRSIAAVGNGVQGVEQALGLSFENDVLPWAGQAGFALTDVRKDGPGLAILLQIRDAERMMGSARVEALLQSMLESKAKVTWLSMDIKGVAIRRTVITRGKSVLKIATATLDGWLVIAVGDGVIRKVIDTHHGDTPSLETHPLFTKAMGGLPEDAVGQLCVNGQGILAQIGQNNAGMAKKLKDSELGKLFLGGAMTSPGGSLQFDTIYCTTSPTTQATLKGLRADAGAISGASLAQLPEGAFATLLISNPDKWVGAVEQLILDSAGDANARKSIQQGFAAVGGVRDVLKRCTGELGVGVAWQEGNGIGVTMAAETGAADDATATAAAVGSLLEKFGVPVEKKDSLYSLPATKGGNPIFTMLLGWTTRQQWLIGASHPKWITPPATKPSLQLPAGAKDANLALFGDFSFLPGLMKSMGMNPEMLAQFAPLTGGLGQWAMVMKIDEDGGAVRSHITGGLPVFATTAAVLFPVFAKARDKARTTASVNNLRQLAIALNMYVQDNKERLPVMKTAADIKTQLLTAYGMDQILTSPRTHEPYTPNPSMSGKWLGEFQYPVAMIIFYENTPGSDGSRCAAFLDGHVEVISADDWEAAKKRSKIP
ncbi:MAG: DUF3352 domain-containing protein [Armatimonadota bacterium]